MHITSLHGVHGMYIYIYTPIYYIYTLYWYYIYIVRYTHTCRVQLI